MRTLSDCTAGGGFASFSRVRCRYKAPPPIMRAKAGTTAKNCGTKSLFLKDAVLMSDWWRPTYNAKEPSHNFQETESSSLMTQVS